MEYLQPYLSYFSQHPAWAIVLIFSIAFGEALLIIGLFVPSTAVLIGAGMLVGTGHLNFWPVFLATLLGAVLGDQLSYWAGRLYGERLKTMWPLNRYPGLVARGESFVRSHGGKSIAIGRFVPGVKAVVPGIVGTFGMSQLWFATINVLSGIVWSGAHIFPGMLLGQGLALAGELSGRLVVALLILLVLIAVAGWAIRLFVGGLAPWIEFGQFKLSRWARAQPGKWWRRFGRIISPTNPRAIVIIVFAAVAVTSLFAFIRLVSSVFETDTLLNADLSIHNMMTSVRSTPGDEFMVRVTMLGDGLVMLALAAAMIGWLLLRRAWRAAIAVAVTLFSARLFVPLMQTWIKRERPLDFDGFGEVFSFPASHTAIATVTLGVLAVLVSHSMRNWGRAVVFAAAGIMAVIFAYSRIYLGAHWMTDVLGGFLFGAVMTAAFGIAVEAVPSRRIMPPALAGVCIAAFLVAGFIHIDRDYEDTAERYAPRESLVLYDVEQWRRGGWAAVSSRRVDIAGRVDERFICQWAGDPLLFEKAMGQNGWALEPKWSWSQSALYLDPTRSFAELIPRPALHHGRAAVYTWTKPVSDGSGQRMVVRMWKTDFEIAERGSTHPIYVVSLMRERLRRGFSLYAVPSPVRASPQEIRQFAALVRSIPGTRQVPAIGLAADSEPALIDATGIAGT
ncbi:MAG: bifunctional DedA family/phosphatase PAP2 family protein [Hyphomicrobiales bacterium]